MPPRCREVLDLVADGWTNKAIGFELGITEGTVKTYTDTAKEFADLEWDPKRHVRWQLAEWWKKNRGMIAPD